jgi:hypothetical protein
VHLLRNVPFAIPSKKTHLTAALRDLNSEAVIERFGLLFLHDLDINQGRLHTIEQEDNDEVHRAIGLHKKRRKVTVKRLPTGFQANTGTAPNNSHPLGTRPTWGQIQECLKHNPVSLFRNWEYNANWDADDDTSDLFVQFTNDFWLALNRKALSEEVPDVLNLEDAMRLWSAASVHQKLLNVSFMANSEKIGNGKRQSWSFRNMSDVFFPEPETPMAHGSAWQALREHGYLKKFAQLKDTVSDEEFLQIRKNISILFGKVQCLPHSLLPKTNQPGRLWKARFGTIEMLTNSRHYKLMSIGQDEPKSSQRKVTRVNAHPTEITARLDRLHSGISFKATRRKGARSVKMRNKRRPPPPRHRNSKPKGKPKDKGSGESCDMGQDTSMD